MGALIKICNNELEVKSFKNQRVVTFKDVDNLHQRPEGTASRNFRENKKHFIENEDYFFVKPADVQPDEIRRAEINNFGTYLITESGYLMLVKSLTDDLAWKVQRMLVKVYFQYKQNLQKEERWKLRREASKLINNEMKENIKNSIPESPHKSFKYKAYFDFAYKLTTGKNAKQLREDYGLKKGITPLDYLSEEQIESFNKTIRQISVLIDLGNDYQTIKDILTKRYLKSA